MTFDYERSDANFILRAERSCVFEATGDKPNGLDWLTLADRLPSPIFIDSIAQSAVLVSSSWSLGCSRGSSSTRTSEIDQLGMIDEASKRYCRTVFQQHRRLASGFCGTMRCSGCEAAFNQDLVTFEEYGSVRPSSALTTALKPCSA